MRHFKTVLLSCLSLWLMLDTGCARKSPDQEGNGNQGDAREGQRDRHLTLDLGKGVTMELVLIPAGKFLMGSAKTDTDDDNKAPQHEVTISRPFYMGVTEVTQAQWRAVMNAEPWKVPEFPTIGDDRAASYVSWNDAVSFCKALSKKTGRPVRLPTEAEWEYACRAGTTTRFCYGDDPDHRRLGEYAWYDGNALANDDSYPRPVGAKKPNAWGLYDVHGNVWELCSDRYYHPYGNADTGDPQRADSGKFRVARGGSGLSYSWRCRVASRKWYSPVTRDHGRGFRVVVRSGSGAVAPGRLGKDPSAATPASQPTTGAARGVPGRPHDPNDLVIILERADGSTGTMRRADRAALHFKDKTPLIIETDLAASFLAPLFDRHIRVGPSRFLVLGGSRFGGGLGTSHACLIDVSGKAVVVVDWLAFSARYTGTELLLRKRPTLALGVPKPKSPPEYRRRLSFRRTSIAPEQFGGLSFRTPVGPKEDYEVYDPPPDLDTSQKRLWPVAWITIDKDGFRLESNTRK